MGYRWLSGTIAILLMGSGAGMAQSYPDCPPPANGEYLLLVRGDDEATRDRTIAVLPVDKPTLVCNYVGDTVVRAGGFNSLEVANSWALYLNDIEELNTVVVEPSTLAGASTPEPSSSSEASTPVEEQPPETAEQSSPETAEQSSPETAEQSSPESVDVAAVEAPVNQSSQPQYQPTLLGDGVAVLVDYQQNPDIGRDLAQQGDVGLAVYLQQPYLLVMHTTDSSAAAARLQQLVDSGLTSFLVDGQQVIRLTNTVR